MLHKAGDWEVIAIDQGFTPITHKAGLDKYTNKVSTYITKLVTKVCLFQTTFGKME